MSGFELAILMQHLGAAIEKVNPIDIQLLLANKATFDIVVTPASGGRSAGSHKPTAMDLHDVEMWIERLDASLSRELGVALLRDLSKAQLQAIAKHISVSIDSSASKDRIVEKIVERRVGLRLRQDAFAQAMHTD